MAELVSAGAVDAGWAAALAPVATQWAAAEAFVAAQRAAGVTVLPPPERVYRAFRDPFAAVRVLIVGQDPYPTPGHAIGLSFAVDPLVRPVPRSLRNIYTELQQDLGTMPPEHGDLSPWSEQGVMLLNRVLTVAAGEAGSHRNRGWEAVTEQAVRALVARTGTGAVPLVVMLWGKQAESLRPLLHPLADGAVIVSAHPSPLSARRGFFGSHPFSRANAALVAQGAAPVDWRLG
ncbi:MAG: uracil-DNA glycosylase [Cryobacterium sp.]